MVDLTTFGKLSNLCERRVSRKVAKSLRIMEDIKTLLQPGGWVANDRCRLFLKNLAGCSNTKSTAQGAIAKLNWDMLHCRCHEMPKLAAKIIHIFCLLKGNSAEVFKAFYQSFRLRSFPFNFLYFLCLDANKVTNLPDGRQGKIKVARTAQPRRPSHASPCVAAL